MRDILDRARRIQLAIFDVDGVLTDGSIFIGDDGQEYKAFHTRDGHGMVMLRETGVTLAIITGRTSEVVRIRMRGLGINLVYQGIRDKLTVYEELKRSLTLNDDAICYLGDDVVDLPILRRVGLAVAVADAHPLVQRHAHWRTPSAGGKGAARDLCELIMEAQGSLAGKMAPYLSHADGPS